MPERVRGEGTSPPQGQPPPAPDEGAAATGDGTNAGDGTDEGDADGWWTRRPAPTTLRPVVRGGRQRQQGDAADGERGGTDRDGPLQASAARGLLGDLDGQQLEGVVVRHGVSR